MEAPASARTEKCQVSTDLATAASALVRRSVAAQELLEVVDDAGVLRRVATIVRSARQVASY